MKTQVLAALGALAVLLSACSKNDEPDTPGSAVSPITGLQLPASGAESPIPAGSTVTLQGSGFSASDEIWLRTPAKAAGDLRAADVKLLSGGLSFTAPEAEGLRTLILKRADKEYALGALYFAPTPPQTPARLISSGLCGEDYLLTFYEIDPLTGKLTDLCTVPETGDFGFYGMIQLPGTQSVYGVLQDLHQNDFLGRFDLENRTFTQLGKISHGPGNTALGLIGDQLHALVQDEQEALSLVKIDPATGAISTVAELGHVGPEGSSAYLPSQVFQYDEASKRIFSSVYIYKAPDELSYTLQIDLTTKKAAVDNSLGLSERVYLRRGEVIFAWEVSPVGDEGYRTDLYVFNPATGRNGDRLATLDGYWYTPCYDSATQRIYGVLEAEESNELKVYDFATGKISALNSGVDISEIVLVK